MSSPVSRPGFAVLSAGLAVVVIGGGWWVSQRDGDEPEPEDVQELGGASLVAEGSDVAIAEVSEEDGLLLDDLPIAATSLIASGVDGQLLLFFEDGSSYRLVTASIDGPVDQVSRPTVATVTALTVVPQGHVVGAEYDFG